MITKLVEGKNGVKLPVVHKEKLTLEEAFGENNSNANSRTMRKVNEDIEKGSEKRYYACVEFNNGEQLEDTFDTAEDAQNFCQTTYTHEGAVWAGVYDDVADKPVWQWTPKDDLVFDEAVNEDKSQLVAKAKKEKIMPAQRNHVSLKGQKEIQGKGIYAHNEHPEKKVKEIDEDFDYQDGVNESIDEPKPGKTISLADAVELIDNAITSMGKYATVEDDGEFIHVNVEWGDWKHDHRAIDYAIQNLFYNATIDEDIYEEDGSDCYSADHIIEFEGGQPQLNDGVKFEGGND